MDLELKKQMEALQGELKSFLEKAKEQEAQNGSITTELKEKLETLQQQVDAIDVKIAESHRAGDPEETLSEFLQKQDGLMKLLKDKSGSCVLNLDSKQAAQIMSHKTTITSSAVGSATSGVLQIDRDRGIVPEARPILRIRDVLSSRPTGMNQIDFVKVNAAMTKASPQTESSAKAENAVTFTTATALVKTIATWIPATKQVLSDFAELMGFLQTTLAYYVRLEEEEQLLTGDNTGNNLNGLVTQAQAFDTSLLVAAAGYNRIDCIGRAIQQIEDDDELEPTFAVMQPADWWSIRLTKDSYGRYILGDPQQALNTANLFGLMPVKSKKITAGTFLVGSGSPVAAEIRDREGITVEISTQHSDYFTKNMIAIRAEERVALAVKRPNSYVTGTFVTSPSN